MTEIDIDIEQGTELKRTELQKKADKRPEMESAISDIITQISIPSSNFSYRECKEVVDKITRYTEKYERILYATISNKIFAYQKNDINNSTVGNIITNLDILMNYCYESDLDTNCNNHAVCKVILKICDHVNLAQQQYQELHISDKEYKEKFERQMRLEKEKLYHDINSHMVTMIGIFTALSFVIFGGINSIETAFAGMGDTPLTKLMVIGSLWSFGLLNLVYIFLYCIAKLNNLNFKNSDEITANYVQKYQFIVIPNVVIIALMIVSLWMYFITSNNLLLEVIEIFSGSPIWFIVISIIVFFFVLHCVWGYVTNKLDGRDK